MLPLDQVQDNFAVTAAMKNIAMTFQALLQLVRIDNLSVVCDRHTADFRARYNWLYIFQLIPAGCCIPYMADAVFPDR